MKSKSIKILLMGAAITSMLSSCGDSWFESCLLYTSPSPRD